MDTQVLQIALGDHLPNGIGQRADTQLQRGAIHHVLHHELRDLHLSLGCRRRLNIGQRTVVAFHDHIYITDMYAFIQAAVNPGQILIDLQDYDISLVQHRTGRRIADRKIEIPVFVHRRHTHHCHVDCEKM